MLCVYVCVYIMFFDVSRSATRQWRCEAILHARMTHCNKTFSGLFLFDSSCICTVQWNVTASTYAYTYMYSKYHIVYKGMECVKNDWPHIVVGATKHTLSKVVTIIVPHKFLNCINSSVSRPATRCCRRVCAVCASVYTCGGDSSPHCQISMLYNNKCL